MHWLFVIFIGNVSWQYYFECELASSVSWKMFFALFLASGAPGSDGGQEGEMVSGSKRGTSCENLSRLAMLYQYQSDENLSQYL